LVGRNEPTSEVEDLREERRVVSREGIAHLEGLTGGKRRLLTEPLCDIGALPLDEVAGEFPALGGRGLREIELLIVVAQEPKQRLELLGLARVRGCREQDEVLFRLRREATQEVIALLLARRRTGRAGTGVGFIDNHQLGSLLDEQIAAPV